MALLVALGHPILAATVERWISFDAPLINGIDGTANDGRDEIHAAPFTLLRVNEWLVPSSVLNDLTIRFIPSAVPLNNGWDGESTEGGSANYHFQITGSGGVERIVIQGDSARKVRLVGDTRYGYRPVLRLVKSTGSGGWLGDSPKHDVLLNTYPSFVDPNFYSTHAYLERIELENFVLDGDFEAQGAFASTANLGGYKSSALAVAARTGSIRNVAVRRFGSVGRTPVPYFPNYSAGTEAFPVSVMTKADDKLDPAHWNPYPWLIEDIEVSDFRSIHGGYGTMIMPLVADYDAVPADGSNPKPVVVVRRSRVLNNSGAIAFGTAGRNSTTTVPGYSSTRIRWEDNVVLNSGTALNTDTAYMHWLTLCRNVFLDILDGFKMGSAGISTAGQPPHRNYLIENNLIRLRGRWNAPIYRAWDETTNGVDASNPNLALGRPYSTKANVLLLDGRAGNVTFQNNRITTWPLNSSQNLFFLPSPGVVPTAEFRVVWEIPSDVFIDSLWDYRSRWPSSGVTLQNNDLSTKALEFGAGTIANPVNNVAFLAESATAIGTHAGSYSPGYQDLKVPSEMLKVAGNYVFVPQGRTERVQTEFDDQDQLQTVWETVLGTCSLAGTTVSGKVRLMKHGLPGTPAPGTSTPPDLGVRIGAEAVADGAIVTDPIYNAVTVTTDANGVAVFSINLIAALGSSIPPHAVIRLKAWYDHNSPTGPSAFDARVHAWSSLAIPLGTYVTVASSPDVGDDKNTVAAKRAKFRIQRTSSPGTSLAVRVQLMDTGILRPGDNANLTATYGTSSLYDYYLLGGGWPSGAISLNSPQWVTIPSGSDFVELTVVPIADNVTEANVVRLEVLPDLPALGDYSTGASTKVDVTIYDGPEWTIYELRTDNLGSNSTMSSYAYGLNNVNGSTQPRVAGSATYSSGGGYATSGGSWLLPNTSTFSPAYFPTYYGISTSPAKLVGIQGNNAVTVLPDTTLFTTLPALGSPSGARGISGSGQYVAGFSTFPDLITFNPEPKAVVWIDGAVRNLHQNLNDAITDYGDARGVNSFGEVVGQVRFVSFLGLQGFRTKVGGDYIQQASDELPQPGSSFDVTTLANSISEEGIAVGFYKGSAASYKVAAYWGSRQGASYNPQGVSVGNWYPLPPQFPAQDLLGEALGIARVGTADWIVGWSGSSDALPPPPASPPSNPSTKAVVKKSLGGAWLNMNDKFLVHGLTGWDLKIARAVNTSGHIVGNGTLNGNVRGFLLIPRTQSQ